MTRQKSNPVAGLTALEQLEDLDRVVKESRAKRLKLLRKLARTLPAWGLVALAGCATPQDEGPSKDWQKDLQKAIDRQKQ